jgi:hypothetical protein
VMAAQGAKPGKIGSFQAILSCDEAPRAMAGPPQKPNRSLLLPAANPIKIY